MLELDKKHRRCYAEKFQIYKLILLLGLSYRENTQGGDPFYPKVRRMNNLCTLVPDGGCSSNCMRDGATVRRVGPPKLPLFAFLSYFATTAQFNLSPASPELKAHLKFAKLRCETGSTCLCATSEQWASWWCGKGLDFIQRAHGTQSTRKHARSGLQDFDGKHETSSTSSIFVGGMTTCTSRSNVLIRTRININGCFLEGNKKLKQRGYYAS